MLTIFNKRYNDMYNKNKMKYAISNGCYMLCLEKMYISCHRYIIEGISNLMKKFSKLFSYYSIIFAFTFGLINIIFCIGNFAPFGDVSLAYDDGYWQYMDFFSYYKSVLEGKQSIAFSMSTGLGMPNIALFSYYLSSPWNLLVVLFDIDRLHSFFDMVIALKLSTAAVTFSYFLNSRFSNKLNKLLVLALSVTYAFMQYNVSQSTCTMWLDGVYMLPLILLGIYRIVNFGSPVLLSLSVALAIIFNWYSAGIDCIFSVIWFGYEFAIARKQSDTFTMDCKKIFRYIWAMALGVAISAPLFLPTVKTIMNATRGAADRNVFRNEFLGNIVNVICGYTIGATSTKGMLSVFCGGGVLIGVIGFFISTAVSRKTKIATGIVLLICVLSCYYQPLFGVFSMFQIADSYYYRFSYVVCFALIYTAALFFYSINQSDLCIGFFSEMVKAVIIYLIFVFAANYVKPYTEDKYIYITAVYILGLLILFRMLIDKDTSYTKKNVYIYMACFLVVLEMSYNASVLMKIYSSFDVPAFKNYQIQQADLISAIKNGDDGYYRITQTSARRGDINSLANLDESMGFGYWDIGSYVSSPVANQISFMEKIGYRVYGSRLVEKAMVVLPVDSLLGVKYVLSPYEYKDLQCRRDLGIGNGKSVYENAYSMPLAFKINATQSFSRDEQNTYVYQNELFNFMFGGEGDLYFPAQYTVEYGNNERCFWFDVPYGKYSLYGNIPYSNEVGAQLDLNGKNGIGYAVVHSLNNFYVQVDEGEKAYVLLKTADLQAFGEPMFYYLDLNRLSECTDMARENAAHIINMTDTNMQFEIEGHIGESLFVSVPYDEGWKIKINGKDIIPNTIENLLVMVPLEEGNNIITFRYSIPYVREGIVIFLVSVIMLIAWKKVISNSLKGRNYNL